MFVAECGQPLGVEVVPLVKTIKAISLPGVSPASNGFAAGTSMDLRVESDLHCTEGEVVQDIRILEFWRRGEKRDRASAAASS